MNSRYKVIQFWGFEAYQEWLGKLVEDTDITSTITHGATIIVTYRVWTEPAKSADSEGESDKAKDQTEKAALMPWVPTEGYFSEGTLSIDDIEHAQAEGFTVDLLPDGSVRVFKFDANTNPQPAPSELEDVVKQNADQRTFLVPPAGTGNLEGAPGTLDNVWHPPTYSAPVSNPVDSDGVPVESAGYTPIVPSPDGKSVAQLEAELKVGQQ